jgi:hypothetical protein
MHTSAKTTKKRRTWNTRLFHMKHPPFRGAAITASIKRCLASVPTLGDSPSFEGLPHYTTAFGKKQHFFAARNPSDGAFFTLDKWGDSVIIITEGHRLVRYGLAAPNTPEEESSRSECDPGG